MSHHTNILESELHLILRSLNITPVLLNSENNCYGRGTDVLIFDFLSQRGHVFFENAIIQMEILAGMMRERQMNCLSTVDNELEV